MRIDYNLCIYNSLVLHERFHEFHVPPFHRAFRLAHRPWGVSLRCEVGLCFVAETHLIAGGAGASGGRLGLVAVGGKSALILHRATHSVAGSRRVFVELQVAKLTWGHVLARAGRIVLGHGTVALHRRTHDGGGAAVAERREMVLAIRVIRGIVRSGRGSFAGPHS